MSGDSAAFARQITDAFDVPRRLVFSELSDEDVEHDRQQQHRWETERAWHNWRLASCVEFNGDHDMRLRRSEVGGEIELECGQGCGASIDDFYPDGWDFTLFDLPVKVEVETVHYRATPDHGDEWDVFIGLEPR